MIILAPLHHLDQTLVNGMRRKIEHNTHDQSVQSKRSGGLGINGSDFVFHDDEDAERLDALQIRLQGCLKAKYSVLCPE